MGHGREEIGLCPIGGLSFHGRDLKTLVKVKHIKQVTEEQDQQTGRNDSDQQPVFGIYIEILCRHETQQGPANCSRDRGKGKYALLSVGVGQWNGTCRRSNPAEQISRRFRIRCIIMICRTRKSWRS